MRRVQQEQGADASTIQPDANPRQVRSRWSEQLNPLTICSSYSPSPTKSQEDQNQQEEEEEEDFHPQSLDSVLGDEEEEEGEDQESEVSRQAFCSQVFVQRNVRGLL